MAKLVQAKENLINKIDTLFGFNLSNRSDGVSYDFWQYRLNKLYKPLVKYFINQYLSHLEQYSDSEAEKILWLFSDFFSLYYSNGDFWYFKNKFSTYQYRIPYSGKDTEFWRATKDCYYVKTSDVVNDMAVNIGWMFGDKEIQIKLFKKTQSDTSESGDEKWMFDAQVEEMRDDETEEIVWYSITFINHEESKDTKKQKETKIVEALATKEIDYNNQAVKKSIDEFLKKRGRDYFIHKRLKAFLTEELERYFFQMLKTDIQAKADILGIQTKIQEIKAKYSDDPEVVDFKIGQLMKESWSNVKLSLYETAYLWILNFVNILGDLEEFKAKLWNKKRKVIKQEYCITIGKLIEYESLMPRRNEMLLEIVSNKNQLQEREELLAEWHKHLRDFSLDIIKQELETGMINTTTNMVIDTKHFDKIWTLYKTLHERWQKKLYEDGAKLDGLLIKSENYQGLNVLLDDYRSQIQWIYIDPPFNLGENWDFLYKTDYLDGSRATLVNDRFILSKDLLSNKWSIYARCDYHWSHILKLTMWNIFGSDLYKSEIILRKANSQWVLNWFNTSTESLFFFSKTTESFFEPVLKERWREVKRVNCLSPKENKSKNTIEVSGKTYVCPAWQHRRFSQKKIDLLESRWRIRINGNTNIPQYLESDEVALDSNWTDLQWYSFSTWFPTENAEGILYRVIKSISYKNHIILDYFMWSSTSQAVAQKLGRKRIGTEIWSQFEQYDIPRLKSVLEWKQSGISKEKDVDYKWWWYFTYLYLNQYENWFNVWWYMDSIEWDINQLSNIDLEKVSDIKQVLFPLSQLKDKIYGLDDHF